jgi:multiple sugar transport system substrate-binding protein
VSSGHQQFNPVWDDLSSFSAQTGITVQLDKVATDDVQTKALQDLKLGGCTYDNIETPDDAEGALADLMAPLDPFFQKDGIDLATFEAQYVPWDIKATTYGGSLKYYPYYAGAKAVAYRKDLFADPKNQADFQAKYGYALPIPPTTPQQVVDVAKFFTRGGMSGIVFSGQGDAGYGTLADLIFREGIGGITDDTGNLLWGGPKHPENTAKVVAAAKWMQDLVYTYKVAPASVTGMGTDQAVAAYTAGQAAMIFDLIYLPWAQFGAANVTSKIGQSGTFELPSFQPGAGGQPSWWGRGIPACSKHQAASWTFMKWVMADEQIKLALTKGTGVFVPTKTSILEWASAQNVIPVGVADSVKHSQAWTITPATGSLKDQVLIPEMEKLMANAITPSQFADAVGQQGQALLVSAGVAK